MNKILFVCTGNTCRSPMAEGIFNKLSKERGLDFCAESAGVCTVSGLPASENSVAACNEIGVALEEFTSTDLYELSLEDFSLIAVMTKEHKDILVNTFGADKAKVRVLFEDKGGISDPYGGSLARYCQCRDEILLAAEELISGLVMMHRIEPLTPEYADAVLAIETECFSKPWSKSTIEALLQSDKACLFGAFADTQLVGYAALEWVLDEGSLTNIAVLNEYRKGGIGSRLMTELLNCAKEKNLRFVTLEVRVSNTPAIELYRKFGFEDVGVRRRYYDAPTEDALLMTGYL